MLGLSQNEYKILSLLWAHPEGLTSKAINQLTPDKGWKEISIHIILENMQKKGIIYVDGSKLVGKTYARLFHAKLTAEDYTAMQLNENASACSDAKSVKNKFLIALLKDSDITAETYEEIGALLEKKRKGLK